MRVLVIEDEPELRAALTEALRRSGHAVDAAADGLVGLSWLNGASYDLVVLDVGLPGRSGLEVCREARRYGLEAPILMLTARDTLEDKVAGLDAGADDYMVKPFELAELHARVRALLRRSAPRKESVLGVGELRLDPATGEASRAGRPLALSGKQRALLEYLMRHPGRLLTRAQILEHVWGGDAEPDSEVVRAQIKLLRRAIEGPDQPRLIETVHGVGYRLIDHAAEA
ncbi:Transcriptional regulatory protein TcrA [compost metagenome]